MNTQQSQTNRGIFPRFFMGEKEIKSLSEEKGYPQFRDQEMVEITIAGDNRTVVVKKVDDSHKQRWPEQYAAFKRGEEEPLNGLPLKQCPLFTSAQVATMKALNIHTVEALAELNDSAIGRLGMGARAWVAKAKAYIKEGEKTAGVTKLAAENQLLRDEIEMLKLQIKELGSIKAKASEAPEPQPSIASTSSASNSSASSPKIPETFEELNFSQRTIKALIKAGVETPADMGSMTLDDITNLPGIGIREMNEISRLFE